VVAAPLTTPDAVYLAAIHARGFRLSGAIYAINPQTGKPLWTFDRDGGMLPTASSPHLTDGRLLIGEGMHANFACRLYCLDPASGKPCWHFETGDHIEGGVAVEGDTVFFPAGNEGVYAVDSASGQPKWNWRDDLHIDTTPMVEGGRLYVGTGPSRRHTATRVVCLDTRTGNPVWRTPVNLPAWAPPVVAGNRLFVGLGNGRLMEGARPPESPAGAMACFDKTIGTHLWTFPVSDAVFGRPVVLDDRIVFGSRDGRLYGVTFDGRELFQIDVGGPVIAGLAADEGLVFAASVSGRVTCIDPSDGREVWRHELAVQNVTPHVYAMPRVLAGRLYVAGEVRTAGSEVGIVTLYCFELPSGVAGRRGDR
jgi:outer membrane protein assembly factor BamB